MGCPPRGGGAGVAAARETWRCDTWTSIGSAWRMRLGVQNCLICFAFAAEPATVCETVAGPAATAAWAHSPPSTNTASASPHAACRIPRFLLRVIQTPPLLIAFRGPMVRPRRRTSVSAAQQLPGDRAPHGDRVIQGGCDPPGERQRVAGDAELAQHGVRVEVDPLADQAILLEHEHRAEAHLELVAGGRQAAKGPLVRAVEIRLHDHRV